MTVGGLPVLTYHAIDRTGSVVSTDPSRFAETLSALTEEGFRGVDLDDWIARGRPAVERGFALTFDDGLRSILDIADVVARYRVPATVFLVTDRVGTDNAWSGQPSSIPRSPLLSWSEAAALEPLGFRFAAHGRTHVRLARCSDRALDDELRGSRAAIEQRLGSPCRLFAYPYGDVTPRVHRAAAREFAAAFGTRLDLSAADQDVHHLARLDAYYLRSPAVLRRLLSEDLRRWLRVRRTLRATRGLALRSFSGGLAS